jgi:hypothetical protein
LRGRWAGRRDERALQRRGEWLLLARLHLAGGATLVLLELARIKRGAILILDAAGSDQGE